MVRILNTFERAIDLLASQFRFNLPDGSLTNLQKLIQAIEVPAQNLEGVNWELKTLRWLDLAVGVQLDLLGEILGLPRNIGETDESYRERLQFQIFINSSSGTPEDAIRALAFFTQASHIGYFEIPSAFFQLETNGTRFPQNYNDLNTAIKNISPAGVNYAPIVATLGSEIPFEMAGDLSNDLFFVNPDSDPSILSNLLIEPQNSLLYVSIGSVEGSGGLGTLDELDFPQPQAGTLSELIQFGGNFPPVR